MMAMLIIAMQRGRSGGRDCTQGATKRVRSEIVSLLLESTKFNEWDIVVMRDLRSLIVRA